MKQILFLVLIFSLVYQADAQNKPDRKLQVKLEKLVNGFNGEVGIYVKNLKTGKIATVNPDSIFPTASMIKVPIMCGVFDQIEKGNLKYNMSLIYRDSLLYKGSDILGSFKDGEKISLSKVQMLSITTSDNTASLWLQKLVGEHNINGWLEQNGFKDTRLNSSTPLRKPYLRKYGWGQTTPKEMASLVEKIYLGKAVNAAASERMYRNMIRIYFDDVSLSQIPPYVQAASKQGAVNASRSEVVLVNAPHGDYIFCITTKNQKDISWKSSNEGWQLIKNLSKMLWNYYEPKSTWKPAEGIEMLQK